MRPVKTPVERLEFGLRWEAYRLAYFSSIGEREQVIHLTAKLKKLEAELVIANYQFRNLGQSTFK